MTNILDVDRYEDVLKGIVKAYSNYITHNSDVKRYGTMLKYYSAKMDAIYNIFVQMHNYDLIDDVTLSDCTFMFIEYNDDLLSLFYDAVKN